MTRDGDDTLI